MVATVILGMLCVHLLCFSTMFLLISKRLDGNRMGMEVFALGNLLLGVAYALQLVGGVADHRAIGFINHTMTLGAPWPTRWARPASSTAPCPCCAA